MNAQNAKDFLPLVQALSEGKTIQRYLGYERWQDCPGPEIDFCGNADNYRIKMPPRHWWILFSNEKAVVYSDKESAQRYNTVWADSVVIEVQEVVK